MSSSTCTLGLWGVHLLCLRSSTLSSATGKWEHEPDELADLDAIYCAENALGKASLPLKACLVSSKAVHMQFDSGSQEGQAMGKFVILDVDSMGIIWAG